MEFNREVGCDNCTLRTAEPVPYIAHEAAMTRMERTNKRLWILVILITLLFVITNLLWLWYAKNMDGVHMSDSPNSIYYSGSGDLNYGHTPEPAQEPEGPSE